MIIDNVTIAANAVVTKSPEHGNVIIGGIPFKDLKGKSPDDHEGWNFDYMTFEEWKRSHRIK